MCAHTFLGSVCCSADKDSVYLWKSWCRTKEATESKIASKQKFVGLYNAHSRCCLLWMHHTDRSQEIRVSILFAVLVFMRDWLGYIAEEWWFLFPISIFLSPPFTELFLLCRMQCVITQTYPKRCSLYSQKNTVCQVQLMWGECSLCFTIYYCWKT